MTLFDLGVLLIGGGVLIEGLYIIKQLKKVIRGSR